MLKNIDFNKNRQRWKNYFCLFISFLFLIFFYVNRTTILENDPEFSSKFKIASIVLGWIVGVVLIFVRLDFGKKWNRVINILYILFAPCYIFLIWKLLYLMKHTALENSIYHCYYLTSC